MVVSACAIGVMGCQTLSRETPSDRVTRSFRSRLERITPAGSAAFSNGYQYGLAGIRIRSVAETEEPELLDVVLSVVFESGNEVRVEVAPVSGLAMVYYSQRVNKPNMYGWQALLPTQHVRGSLNELLIAMGAAEYDAERGTAQLTESEQRRLTRVAERAGGATHREMRSHVRCVYDREMGYRVRLPAGLHHATRPE